MSEIPEGFRPFHDPCRAARESPYQFERIWLWRYEWQQQQLADPRSLNPAMNAVGLYWRPAEADADLTGPVIETTYRAISAPPPSTD